MCPSIQFKLSERVCKNCRLYFASIKSVLEHKKIHKKDSNSAARVHSVYVLRRRDNEALCVLHDDMVNKHAEWIDVEELDTVFDFPPEEEENLPVIDNFNDWLKSPWTV